MSTEAVVKYQDACGTSTPDGFLITFPHLQSLGKQLHPLDTKYEIGEILSRRIGRSPIKEHPPILHRSRSTIHTTADGSGSVSSAFFNLMTTCFADHHPVCIRPEVLWHLIIHEVGTYVKENADACAHFFTQKPNEKQKLHIGFARETWAENVLAFRSLFDELIDARVMNAFLPTFSTTNSEAEVATLLSFMDTTSKWYSYGMAYVCGFPQILVSGTVHDWKKMVSSVDTLRSMFDGLRYYFAGLNEVLQTIVATLETGKVDPAFWGSMFRYFQGECSPPEVDG